MNIKCDNCKGKGLVQKDGKDTKTRQPYTLVCKDCNGVGYERVSSFGADIE